MKPSCWRCLTCVVTVAAAAALAAADAAAETYQRLGPLDAGSAVPAPPWHLVVLPAQTKPRTRFEIVGIDGARALRIESDRSYANLVHPLEIRQDAPHPLSWRWRVDDALPAADLRQRRSEDAPVRVCATFELPLQALPFVERQVVRAARLRSAESVPTAALCYVWDARLAPGTVLVSPFTRRIRYIVLRGPESPLQTWRHERRDVRADFLTLFADEATSMPPISGVVIGGDADNTQGYAVAHVADVVID